MQEWERTTIEGLEKKITQVNWKIKLEKDEVQELKAGFEKVLNERAYYSRCKRKGLVYEGKNSLVELNDQVSTFRYKLDHCKKVIRKLKLERKALIKELTNLGVTYEN